MRQQRKRKVKTVISLAAPTPTGHQDQLWPQSHPGLCPWPGPCPWTTAAAAHSSLLPTRQPACVSCHSRLKCSRASQSHHSIIALDWVLLRVTENPNGLRDSLCGAAARLFPRALPGEPLIIEVRAASELEAPEGARITKEGEQTWVWKRLGAVA